MNTPPIIFILVVNYNGRKTLPACLRSLFHLEYPNTHILVVDNASTDGSLEKAKTQFPKAHFIRNSENVGFARGANVGIRFALDHGSDGVWIVNPDVIVPKDALLPLVTLLERHPNVGMVSPIITTPSGRHIWFGGGAIQWLRFRAIHIAPRSRTTPFETGFLSGCAPLIRREVFESVGLFDEHFFLYYEDADLSLRAKQQGFLTVIHPHSRVSHSEESRHNPEKTYWLIRSGLFFFRKHSPALQSIFFWTAFWIRRFRNSLRLLHSKRESWKALEKAFRDFLTYGY